MTGQGSWLRCGRCVCAGGVGARVNVGSVYCVCEKVMCVRVPSRERERERWREDRRKKETFTSAGLKNDAWMCASQCVRV